MNAYISNDLNMVKELDPQRHELALKMEEFLNKGGTIEVLQGPSFIPPPVRYEPPPTVKVDKPVAKPAATDTPYMTKIARRDIEREERIAQRAMERADHIERIRKLAKTMTYAQVIEQTGIPRRSLQRLAVEGGFQFLPATNSGNSRKARITDEQAVKYAERINAFKEIGLSRNQAAIQLGVTFRTFKMLLAKFNIDYPKLHKGPYPAFFAKPAQQ
ncbi:hypothetical protein [Pseudomonas moorei]|uniref:hypothetical protein n=1 Tax=Pseudomonas moorei TaxID=395599 RepID=UPI0036F2F312